MAKNPIPFLPFTLWRWMYSRFATKGFEHKAARNGLSRELLAQLYAY
jgi:hypothetical protein